MKLAVQLSMRFPQNDCLVGDRLEEQRGAR